MHPQILLKLPCAASVCTSAPCPVGPAQVRQCPCHQSAGPTRQKLLPSLTTKEIEALKKDDVSLSMGADKATHGCDGLVLSS
jgi:hypothetical protein